MPDPRRPSERQKAPPPGTPFRHPHRAQRRPARAHAVGPVPAPHARTNRTRDTRVAELRPPAPEDGRPGEGQRLTPDAPHNGGRPSPPGIAPHHPRSRQPPQGMQAKGTVMGPHTRTPAPTARGWRTPTARPGGGQSREGERLTSDAPNNGERHPPPLGTPFRHPHSAQRRPARALAVGPVVGPQARTNHTRDTRVAEPRLPAPEDGGPGEGQRLTPDPPHNCGRPPPPPGDGPPQTQRHAAPTRHASQGDSAGPPHPHTRAHSTWVADPDKPPGGRAVGGGGVPDLRRPSLRRKAPPPGTPFRHPHSTQRRPARAHAVGPVPGPHARTNRTRDTRVAELRPPAPEDGRPGEGQRLTPDAPHNGGRPSPPGTAPHHPRSRQPPQGMQAKGTVMGPHTRTPAPTARGWQTPTARLGGGQSREGERLTSDAPNNGERHPPPGDALPPPPQRATPARKGARCGAGGGSPRPHQPHPGHTGRGTPAARPRGRAAGGGRAPDTRRPSQRWQGNPPGVSPPPLPRHAAPAGHASQGDSAEPPHPHTRAHSTSVVDPDSPPGGQAASGGGAPELRRPSQRQQAPLGTPFRQPHSAQHRPARAHAVGRVLGPHARINRTRDTRVAEPWPPGPEDERPGEGPRLTPDPPHNGGRPPPPGRAPHHPRGPQPPQDMQAKGTVLGPHTCTPTPTARR